MDKVKLQIEDITKIVRLFKQKNWDMDEVNTWSLFNRFKETYGKLDNEERQLFVELSYKYSVITLEQYKKYIIDILIDMYSKKEFMFKNNKDIYIMPLLPLRETNKIKSSTLVTYLFNSTDLNYYDKLSKKNFHIIDNYEHLKAKIRNINKGAPLILVDDYIGSGNTAIETINDILLQGIEKQYVNILSLVVQQVGLNEIRKHGIPVFYKDKEDKCLLGASEKDKEIIERIEDKLKVDEYYKTGYEQSEALISLIRTPNNTLPLFWFKGTSRKNYAPFPRK